MPDSVCEDQSTTPDADQGQRPAVEQAASSAADQADSTSDAGLAIDPQRLPYPESTQPLKFLWDYAASLAAVHLVAVYALLPWSFSWLFTWSGLVLAIIGHFVFSMQGVTIGYHRLLTHRGFTCPKWLEHYFAIMGVCTLQDSPARWVAIHRMHHQHSDHQPDPHSPWVNFLWGHIGWLVFRHRDLDSPMHFERYVRDLLRDPFYLRLERKKLWAWIYLGHAVLFMVAGGIYGYSVGGRSEAIRYAASWVVWGVALRTVCDLHIAWAVNSFAHLFGYQNYKTRDHSTNNWLVALLAHGEGWHNNHHAQPRSAAHGHRWWEFDMSWRVIRSLEAVGLAKDVVRPKPIDAASQAEGISGA